jgi:hypothetical protein
MSIYKAPAVPLSDICEQYLGLGYEEALKKAARGELPVPTFRLSNSRKAPLMVSCEDLGAHIDKARDAAAEQWRRSQI